MLFEMTEYADLERGFVLDEFWMAGIDLDGGGVICGSLYWAISNLVGGIGSAIIIVAGILIFLLLLFEKSLFTIIKNIYLWVKDMIPQEEKMPEPKSEKKKKLEPKEPKPSILEDLEEPPFDPDIPIFNLPEDELQTDKQIELPEAETKDVDESEHEFDVELVQEQIEYIIPPVTLLKEGEDDRHSEKFVRELKDTAGKLIETFKSFGVTAKVINVQSGPSVTRYEIEAVMGTKLSKITGLADDLALQLGVSGIRIAPVPGKSAVGIEVPNKTRSSVMMRNCLESSEFVSSESKIAFALGKDITGKTIIADIGKMPHLLIAGATGSGKSVCINTIITSLLYKANPNEVKLLMVDPKVVELGIYNGIPHLVSPVVTEPKKAANALNWAVSEMTRRYKMFADNSVRDIHGYNELALEEETLRPMEQIVIIIDELADLMMVAPNEVEDAICRLAQMARAAGMHLVIATQRPSVDVITGIIKANIPSRIAFTVSSQIDSRTILDSAGAEKLLGRGDMLYYPIGVSKPIRVQGAFVSDKEVESVVTFVKDNSGQAEYNEEAMEFIKRAPETKGKKNEDEEEEEEDLWDPLLPKAIEIVVEMQQASTSMLQRKMRVGYARAARLVDQLEEQGVVGPFEGSKPRAVLMNRQQYLEMVARNGQPEQTTIDETSDEF
ncbi:MAG: DNA translocase FtsK [Ruminococcaceae bacterium]|nr:DNA translocase FtsK [Oscillospiraceae bacterium]